MENASVWTRRVVPYFGNRVIYTWPDETPFVSPPSGQPLRHWADYQLAAYLLGKWTPFVEGIGRNQNWLHPQALSNAFGSVVAVYNALNLPMHMDPRQRALYRDYMASSPGPGLGGGHAWATYEFGQANYNDNWYRAGEVFPTGRCFGGIIPAMAEELFLERVREGQTEFPRDAFAAQVPHSDRLSQCTNRHAPGGRPLRFVPSMNFGLIPDGPNPQDFAGTKPDYALDARNSGGMQWDRIIAPRLEQTPEGGQGTDLDLPNRALGFHAPFRGMWNWEHAFNDGNIIFAPIRIYHTWIREALRAITTNFDGSARTFDQVVFDTRMYVGYVNANTVQAWSGGNTESFLQAVFGEASSRSSSVIDGPGWRALEESAPAVGAVVGSVIGTSLGPGGAALGSAVGGLIGGGVALVAQILANTIRVGRSGYRDDLGRYKPTLERGWLSGNPGSSLAGAAPKLELNAGADFQRGAEREPEAPPGGLWFLPTITPAAMDRSGRSSEAAGSGETFSAGSGETFSAASDSLWFRLGVAGLSAYGAYRLVRAYR